jgi:hypothetical protein
MSPSPTLRDISVLLSFIALTLFGSAVTAVVVSVATVSVVITVVRLDA